MGTDTVKQYAVALPEGYAIEPSQPTNEPAQTDLETQGAVDSVLVPTNQPQPEGTQDAQPKRYATQVPEGFTLQTDNLFEGLPTGQTSLSAAPEPGVIDRAKQAFKDFFTGGSVERQKRADLVYVLATRNRLPLQVVDKNLEEMLNNPQMSGIQQEIPQDLKAGTATVQSFAEALTFGAFDPDPYIKQEFPIQSAVGSVSGGIVTFLATGGVLNALGLGKAAYQAGEAARVIHAAAPRFLPAALMTGSTFATVEGIREAVDQVERKNIDPLAVGKASLASFAEGASIGAVGQAVGPLRRVLMAGGLGYISGQARGYTAQESAIQGAIWGGIEAFGGIGRDKALKDKALVDVRDQLARYAKTKKPGMTTEEATTRANEYIVHMANGDLEGAMKTTPIGFMERAARNVAKMIKDWKGVKNVDVLKEATKTVTPEPLAKPKPAASTGREVSTQTVSSTAKAKFDKIAELQLYKQYFEGAGKAQEAAKIQEMIDRQALTPEEEIALMSEPPTPAAQKATEKMMKVQQLELVREFLAKTGDAEKLHKIDQLLAKTRLTPEDHAAIVEGLGGAAGPEIPEFKTTDEAVQFGLDNKDNPEIMQALKAKREEMQARAKELSDKPDATPAEEAEAFKLVQQAQFPREALEAAEGKINPQVLERIQKKITKGGMPSANEQVDSYLAGGGAAAPAGPREKFEPMKTQDQLKRIAKKKETKKRQQEMKEVPYAAGTVAHLIRMRRADIDIGNFETNLFINMIERQTTKPERELMPFLIERTDVPAELGRPDLEQLWIEYQDSGSELAKRLAPIVAAIRVHFDEGWKFMQANMDELTVNQIIDYITHIWRLSEKKKMEITNAFKTKNQYLNKRFIETYKQGIQDFGLKPRTLDVAEIIRIHDNVMHKTIANRQFVKALMRLRHDGVPLVERADLAPHDWVLFTHPALAKALIIPGDPKKGERITEELHILLNELGLAVGKRIAPTIFGKPAPLGQYWHTQPPEIRLQRFFSTHTLAHEIGHFLHLALDIPTAAFVNKYRDEILALNRERIKRLSKLKGSISKYGSHKEYAESDEEMVAEFFAFLFTDIKKAKMLAPGATAHMLGFLARDGKLSKLANFDFETKAKLLIAEQLNTLVKLPVKVHPDLEKPLRVVFDERFYHPVIRAYEMTQAILKKSWLSISLFHHTALGETSMATMGLQKTAEVAFNFPEIYRALAKGDYAVFRNQKATKKWIRRGLQIGATADIPVHRIQQALNEFATNTKNTPVLGKVAEFAATFNEGWDKALWNYYHDTLKLYAAEHLGSRIDPNRSRIQQEQEIAQLVNDTFGGQNWDVLMVSPKIVQIMTWGLLSPDWFLSTMRQAMAFTGAGAIYKETKELRGKLGRLFWLKAFMYFGVGINLLNVANRLADKRKNPGKYADRKDLIDFTMWGNALGHKTHLFMGRYEDGSERYVRWGKQFREIPEMLIDDSGFNPITASLKRLGAKIAPVPQTLTMILTGHSLSGYNNRDISEAEGWDRVWNTFLYLAKSPFPFSARNLIEKDREFHLTDVAMPSSKGMTRYKAVRLFKVAVEHNDEQLLKEVWQDAVDNNLPPETLFKAALSSIQAEGTKEQNSRLKTVADVDRALDEAKDPKVIRSLKRRRARLVKEAREIEKGSELLQRAIDRFIKLEREE